jgi:hypothetical protein
LPASHAKHFGEARCAILDQVSKQFMVPLIDHIVDSHAFGPHHKLGSNTEKQAERFLDKRGGRDFVDWDECLSSTKKAISGILNGVAMETNLLDKDHSDEEQESNNEEEEDTQNAPRPSEEEQQPQQQQEATSGHARDE